MKKTTNSLHADSVGVPATFNSSVCTDWKKKCWSQHDTEVLFERMITDIKEMSPWRRRNGDMPVSYSRLAALRRDQCGMMAESWGSGVEKRQ
jgi:isochorismate hydrolase